MARTFIGELILRLKDEMSGKAKTAANNLDTSIDRIQRAARQLNKTTWGGQFEERLRKLGASAGDIDKLRTSWDNLHTSMTSRNLGKAMQSLEKSNFKTAALGYFSDIATKAKDAETNIGNMHARWKEAAKDMAVYGTIGAIMYGGANAIRGGVVSSAEMMREKSRWRDANIPDSERDAAIAEADRLTTQYPSAGLLSIVELARKARAMMGDNERGLAILPDLARAFVALQSAKGTDAAVQELEGFLKGADVAGLNAPGQRGIDSIRSVIAGWVRAAQVEGRDLDVGKFLEFSRYGKMAVPGLSDRFLAGVLPAIVQDFGPSQFGNALNMAYKSFVIGSNSVAGKKNLAAQRALGIRSGEGKGELVQDDLFGTDPYAWVNQILIPALKKQGVDTENNVQVSKAIAELASNSNATTVLTRLVTQKAQIDRLLEQYDAAKGLESADTAAMQDPFVAWKGFIESWRELAAEIKGMPEAVAGLNMLTSGLQRFATALREKDGGAQALLAGAGLGAGFAAWKITAAIWGLMTAGTNLNTAAAALQAAAISLGAQGTVGDLADPRKKSGLMSKVGSFLPWLGRLGLPVGAALAAFEGLDSVPHAGYESAQKDNPNLLQDMERDRRRRAEFTGGFEGGMHTAGAGLGPKPGSWNQSSVSNRPVDPYAAAIEYMDRRKAFEADTGPRGNTPGLDQYFKNDSGTGTPISGFDLRDEIASAVYELMKPTRDRLFEEVPKQPIPATNFAGEHDQRLADAHQENADTRQAAEVSSNPKVTPDVNMSSASAAASEAATIGRQIEQALSVSARPHVDNGSLQETLRLVNAIKAGLAGIGGAIQQAHTSVSRQMNRNFTDHGVVP